MLASVNNKLCCILCSSQRCWQTCYNSIRCSSCSSQLQLRPSQRRLLFLTCCKQPGHVRSSIWRTGFQSFRSTSGILLLSLLLFTKDALKNVSCVVILDLVWIQQQAAAVGQSSTFEDPFGNPFAWHPTLWRVEYVFAPWQLYIKSRKTFNLTLFFWSLQIKLYRWWALHRTCPTPVVLAGRSKWWFHPTFSRPWMCFVLFVCFFLSNQ